jgi:hypothetical protein
VIRGLRFDLVSDGPIASQPSLEHAGEHGNFRIDVIEDADNLLAVLNPMQPPNVLLQCTPPRNRHREEESIEPGIVEAFADVAPGRK